MAEPVIRLEWVPGDEEGWYASTVAGNYDASGATVESALAGLADALARVVAER